MRSILYCTALGVVLALTGAAAASAQDVEERIQSGALSFSGGKGFSNAVLTVTGPGDFEAEETASRGLPVFRAQNSGRLVDGLYQYTLVAATDEKVEIKNPIDNGRGTAERGYLLKPFSMYGSFVISKGSILPADEVAGGADGDKVE